MSIVKVYFLIDGKRECIKVSKEILEKINFFESKFSFSGFDSTIDTGIETTKSAVFNYFSFRKLLKKYCETPLNYERYYDNIIVKKGEESKHYDYFSKFKIDFVYPYTDQYAKGWKVYGFIDKQYLHLNDYQPYPMLLETKYAQEMKPFSNGSGFMQPFFLYGYEKDEELEGTKYCSRYPAFINEDDSFTTLGKWVRTMNKKSTDMITKELANLKVDWDMIVLSDYFQDEIIQKYWNPPSIGSEDFSEIKKIPEYYLLDYYGVYINWVKSSDVFNDRIKKFCQLKPHLSKFYWESCDREKLLEDLKTPKKKLNMLLNIESFQDLITWTQK